MSSIFFTIDFLLFGQGCLYTYLDKPNIMFKIFINENQLKRYSSLILNIN